MGNDIAIRVVGVGKQYRLGGQRARYRTVRESLTNTLKAPFQWLRSRSGRATKAGELFWALRDVFFEVKRGDLVGIIGRNGAGKSTLLKILSRITGPTEGEIDLYGRVGSLLEVDTGFHPELTGRENIFLSGAILGMSRSETARKFDDIVAFAEVEKFIDTPVKHYSSGMYTRLGFAVAAHLEPEILIVDEVLAVGDAPFQQKCLGKMEQVGQSGRTVLFVSHNMQAIQRLCRRVLLLDKGKLVADAPAPEVIHQYIGKGRLACAERTWRPDDAVNTTSDVKLLQARVLDQAGVPATVFNILDHFTIEVDYFSSLIGPRPTAILQIFNEDGTCLFSSNEFNSPQWRAKASAPGVVRARCRVPGNLMAEGGYYVLVAVGSYNPNVVYCLERDALAFQIVDRSGGAGVRGEYVGEWPGVMRPMLEWSVEYVETSLPTLVSA
jgi:lipopolysaccharide transport system ATP-binding protein